MFKISLLALFIFLSSLYSNAQVIERVEPPSWWVGFENDTLQLMLYGKNLSDYDLKISSPLVKVLSIHQADSPNYLFVDLRVLSKQSFSFEILLLKDRKIITRYKYRLFERSAEPQGFTQQDVIYLLMPDRFANAQIANDKIIGYVDKVDRNDPDARHGGDLQGIIDHLDYFKDKLNITALWLNPVLENNNPQYSYHGYGITDFYKVDPRLGNNDLYKKLVRKSHDNGLKVIMDVIYNHCSINHWWMKDLPFTDWINKPRTYQHYHGSVIVDPYASEQDKNELVNSWFVPSMADLNQKNKFLANYLIQNTLWWIEFAGLDALRIDTYVYCYNDFMNTLINRLKKEYPNLSILGETWFQKASIIAPFQQGAKLPVNFKTGLNSVTDFGLYYAISNGLREQNNDWQSGLGKIYYRLVEDYLYAAPYNLVIFIDNHDVERIFTSLGYNVQKMKMAIALLMTMRGIPVVYYGTEIAMTSHGKTDGDKRKDFPGGWQSDSINVFTGEGLDKIQKEIFDYFTFLSSWRKNAKPIYNGQFLHFIPRNDIYVYFRYNNEMAIMVVLNNGNEQKQLEYKRYIEILKNYSTVIDIFTNKRVEINKIKVLPQSAAIFELYK